MTAVFLLHHLLQEAARRYPDNEAVVLGEEHITYRTLDQLSNGLANTLLDQGLQKGDRVVLCLRKSVASFICMYGALKSGGCYVPVDPDAPPVRFGQIVRDSRAAFLLTTSGLLENVRAELGESDLRSVVLFDDAATTAQPLKNGAELILGDLSIVSFKGTPQGLKGLPNSAQPIESDTACIYYTSGSTGTPKGVMRSHRSMLASAESIVDFEGFVHSDRVACQFPLHFAASSPSIFGSCIAGSTLVFAPESNALFPGHLAKLVESERASVLNSVPSALILMILYGNPEAHDLSHLRVIAFGGEAFSPKHLSRLMALIPNARFINVLGSTEMPLTSIYEVKSIDSGQVSPIGKAPENVEIFAINDDGRRIEKPGEKGELYVRGPMIMQGYWGDPERTARTLVKNPLRPDLEERVLKTGDMVTLDNEGNYILLGREDQVVKSWGNRVDLGEVEATIYAHPAVKEVAVVPIPDDLIGNRIAAFVSLQDGSSAKREDLLAHCAQRLPRYMVPSSIEFRDSLPRNPAGKIDKASLIKEEVARERARSS